MQIRTDLAVESGVSAPPISGVEMKTQRMGEIEKTVVTIHTQEAAEKLGKAPGHYVTFSFPLTKTPEQKSSLSRQTAEAVKKMLPPEGNVLLVGLGNRHMTADALGSEVIDQILITRHLEKVTEESMRGRLRSVCAIAPGVLGITGIETADMVRAIVGAVHPAAVIAIDALAARESNRIGTTIQITDTGIQPGSGVGNHRLGLTQETLGVPVLALGVPMVLYAVTILRDAFGLLLQDLDGEEAERDAALQALLDKMTQYGMGELVVTPREIDALVGRTARILADSLNMALQERLSEKEIMEWTHDP